VKEAKQVLIKACKVNKKEYIDVASASGFSAMEMAFNDKNSSECTARGLYLSPFMFLD